MIKRLVNNKSTTLKWLEVKTTSFASLLLITLLILDFCFKITPLNDYLYVLILGGIFSGIELASRYKDEPIDAINCLPGFIYILINGLICCFGYFLIITFDLNIQVSDYLTATAQKASDIIFASLTSFLVMRSSFLRLGTESNQADLGLNIIIKKLILIVDRQVDRYQASSRAINITTLLENVSFKQLEIQVFPLCLQVMQNVPQEEIDEINEELEKLSIFEEKDEYKKEKEKISKLSAGLKIYSLVGNKVLETAIKRLELEDESSTCDADKCEPGSDDSDSESNDEEHSPKNRQRERQSFMYSESQYEKYFKELIDEATKISKDDNDSKD